VSSPQHDQQYGGRQGHRIGRHGNGLGTAWGSTGAIDRDDDPDRFTGRRPRMTSSFPVATDTDLGDEEGAEETHLEISEALSCLTARQSFVIGLRYGLRDGHEYALEDIAELMGMTFQAVSDLERRGLKALKNRLARGGGNG